jgi:hypothetical protein
MDKSKNKIAFKNKKKNMLSSFTWTLILIIVFIISLLVSFTIEDNTLKICYWLVVFLLALTIFNIILSVQYYIDLRNQEGIRGPRGAPGRKGPPGPQGVCGVSDKCGLDNCQDRILDEIQNAYPEINPECLRDVKMCNSSDQKEKASVLQKEIETLVNKCKTSKDPLNAFLDKIRPHIESLGENGHTTD